MGYESQRSAVWDRFRDQWGSNSMIEWEGVPFQIPSPATGYVKLSIDESSLDKAHIGATANLDRQIGYIVIDVYVPSSQTTKKLYELMDLVVPIFLGETFSGITCTNLDVASDEREGWEIRIMRFSFYHDM